MEVNRLAVLLQQLVGAASLLITLSLADKLRGSVLERISGAGVPEGGLPGEVHPDTGWPDGVRLELVP